MPSGRLDCAIPRRGGYARGRDESQRGHFWAIRVRGRQRHRESCDPQCHHRLRTGYYSPSDPAFSAFELSGALLGRPEGPHTLAYPKVLTSSSGRLDLLWADADAPFRPRTIVEWPGGPLTSLWHASYEPGRGWSAPQLLYTAKSLGWEQASVSVSAHAVISAVRTLDKDGRIEDLRIVLVRAAADGEWTARELPADISGFYPNVAERDHELFLAYVAAVQGAGHDENSVFLARSRDDARTWTTHLVARSGWHGAHTPVVALGVGHDIDLVWRQKASMDASKEVSSWGGLVLRHVGSHDDGATWSAPVDLGPPSTSNDLRVLADACGVLHVTAVVSDDSLTDSRFLYTTWRGAWSPFVDLFPAYDIVASEMIAADHGRPVLIFMARRRPELFDVPLRTYQSTLVDSVRERRDGHERE
jgi:hypothetical protein